MLNRTIECMRRTIAADLKPAPCRSSASGITVLVKKVAVSFTRSRRALLDSAPVRAIGKAAYLFMKVPMKPPRMTKRAPVGVSVALEPGALFDQFHVQPGGNRSISWMKRTSSGGADGKLSSPWSQACSSIFTKRPESVLRY